MKDGYRRIPEACGSADLMYAAGRKANQLTKKLSQSRWKVRLDPQGYPLTSTCICSMGTLMGMWAHTYIHTETDRRGCHFLS